MLAIPSAKTQDSTGLYEKTYSFPDKFFGAITRRSDKFQSNVEKSTAKYLNKLARREERMKRQLMRKDSVAAKEIFGDISQSYQNLREGKPAGVVSGGYNGRVDSMKTALRFLQENKLLSQSPSMQANYQSLMKEYADVQGKLDQSNYIQHQLVERQKKLKEKLSNLGYAKQFRKYQQQVYYYRSRMDAYKNALSDFNKMESTLLKTVNKIPEFNRFFSKHSQLASLFRLPGQDLPTDAELTDLQSRQAVTNDLQQRFGSGANVDQYMKQNISSAQGELSKIKLKQKKFGNAGQDIEMPDFKPNHEKSKNFLKRLEMGTNMQSVKSNSFFPVTSDIGLSLGYKLNPKSIVGIGLSYKMGWGRELRHIAITHEGIGLRTFSDFKLKGSFWITGGGEWNHRARFKSFDELKNNDAWQPSILTGLNKKYKMSKKISGNVQLLYDFLYRKQVPMAQPVVFRMGFGLK
jgi:hypothetical protein